jgi:hypothetical protein
MEQLMARCPHRFILFCPLYVAAHMGEGLGCDDGKMDDGVCAVARGQSYVRSLELLRVKCPGLVETLEWKEAVDDRGQQIRRNVRAAGLH